MKRVTHNDKSDQSSREQAQSGIVDTAFAHNLEFGMLTLNAAKSQRVTVRLLGYSGSWRNSMYDNDKATEVQLIVDRLTWNKDEKTYTFEGNRVKGDHIGDQSIAAASKSERYRIAVAELSKPIDRFESLSASWSLIPIARP